MSSRELEDSVAAFLAQQAFSYYLDPARGQQQQHHAALVGMLQTVQRLNGDQAVVHEFRRWVHALLYANTCHSMAEYEMRNSHQNPLLHDGGEIMLDNDYAAEDRLSFIEVRDSGSLPIAGDRVRFSFGEEPDTFSRVFEVDPAQRSISFSAGLTEASDMPVSAASMRFLKNLSQEKAQATALALGTSPAVKIICACLVSESLDGGLPRTHRQEAHPTHAGIMDANVAAVVSLDAYQQAACDAIIGSDPRETPFHVIFGPPGTGKTQTLVGLVLGLHLRAAGNRKPSIVLCAPSNAAADSLTLRIGAALELLYPGAPGAFSLMRLCSPSVSVDESPIPRRWRTSTMVNLSGSGQRNFIIPTLTELSHVDIIVTTCHCSSHLHIMGMDPPTHLIIDEAGQTQVPEILVPLMLLNRDLPTAVVFAGDPRQLGPVILSDAAEKLGLGTSLLEHLIEGHDPPEAQGMVGVHPLQINYRSHPAIISLFSSLFYPDLPAPGLQPKPGAAEAAAGLIDMPRAVTSLQAFGLPVTPETPLCFRHVQGHCTRGTSALSASWQNEEEAREVLAVIQALRRGGVAAQDIVVCTPYRAQLTCIRRLLGPHPGAKGVEVDVVEKFQGRESPVVIISFVRSASPEGDTAAAAEAPGAGTGAGIGFLKNMKRLNVSLSRAQSLMIVVGNAKVLRAAGGQWTALIGKFSDWHALAGLHTEAAELD